MSFKNTEQGAKVATVLTGIPFFPLLQLGQEF